MQPGSEKIQRVIVDLYTSLTDWLQQANKDDAIRVICGGPGCGKSSFGKMFAAKLAETSQRCLLFVPLHQINPSLDLSQALEDFIETDLDGILPPNPLGPDRAQQQLLLIFDGLDELAMQGKAAMQVARDFVQEVQTKLLAYNRTESRVFVLISGRDLVIQANRSRFRREGQVLHVLPYMQTDSERKKHQIVDEEQLLRTDQRHIWWRNYGKLRQQNYRELPSELDRGKLTEITAQPLLNYLVALSYDSNELDFSQNSNLNTIYADLLDRVYDRGWENYQHPALGDMDKDGFLRILEEIAVACWQGNGRTATLTEIQQRCANSNLQRILSIFQEGAQEGVTRLLTSFYFRRSDAGGGDETFEFTHKSFGEYLTAKRIVRLMALMQQQLSRHQEDPDIGWNERECLKRWVEVCGPSTLDEYLLGFLRDEVRSQNVQQVSKWQQTLCSLIGFMLRQGMPMEALQPRPSYLEETRQARNAEEALLVALSTCPWVTRTISDIDWPDRAAFGTWLARLQGQRTGENNCVALMCLNHLKLNECILDFRDFNGARLKGAHLHKASLHKASFDGASLPGVRLPGASLRGASLRGANLTRASLDEANLTRTSFNGATLTRASLRGASLRGASLHKASLDGASLDGVSLDGVSLDGASLDGASLKDISWNVETNWRRVQGLETANNVPEQLKRELGLSAVTHDEKHHSQ